MTWPLRDHEVNAITSFFHLAAFLVTCTAMAQSGWFHVRGMQCAPHLGLTPFFGFGDYGVQAVSPAVRPTVRDGDIDVEMPAPVTVSYLYTSNDSLACVSPRLVNLMRIILLLCFMVVLFSLLGVFLNVSNFKNENVKVIQRTGVLSVICVLWVIAIVGVCYYVTLVLEEETSGGGIKNVDVSYEYGFYTITAAGVISILGAATNLLSAAVSDQSIQRRHLLEDWDGLESFNFGPSPRGRLSRASSISGPLPRPGLGPFVPAPPRRNRPLSTSESIRGRSPLEVMVGGDLAMLPPPPPYTP